MKTLTFLALAGLLSIASCSHMRCDKSKSCCSKDHCDKDKKCDKGEKCDKDKKDSAVDSSKKKS